MPMNWKSPCKAGSYPPGVGSSSGDDDDDESAPSANGGEGVVQVTIMTEQPDRAIDFRGGECGSHRGGDYVTVDREKYEDEGAIFGKTRQPMAEVVVSRVEDGERTIEAGPIEKVGFRAEFLAIHFEDTT